MKYNCGTEVMLGDEIMVEHGPDRQALARVVAIGIDLVADDIDQSFYSWAKKEGMIDPDSVVVDWVRSNPFTHSDSNHAPVGSYLTLQSLCCEKFVRRARESK